MSYDDAWSDRRLMRELSQLQRALGKAQARAEESDSRLAELGAAFDAFVELAEVRAQLLVPSPSAVARERAKTLIGVADAVGEGGGADGELVDVPGYWLPPAVLALAALARGDREAAEAPLAKASARDHGRTALLLTLALISQGRPELAAPWFEQALGPAPESSSSEISSAVRELWFAAASGAFGSPGRAAMSSRLTVASDESAVDELHAMVTAQVSPAQADGSGRSAALDAAGAALAALRNLWEFFDAGPVADAGPAQDCAAEVRGVLESLIEEGSPAEAGLISQARRLAEEVRVHRSQAVAGSSVAVGWDSTVGTVLGLLMRDLRTTSPDAQGLRELAQTALRRPAAAVAERLAAAAASPEPPARFAMRLDELTVDVFVGYPLEPQLRELYAAIEQHEAGRSDAARRVAARKHRVLTEARAAADRIEARRAQLAQVRETAAEQYTALLAHLGHLAEHEDVP